MSKKRYITLLVISFWLVFQLAITPTYAADIAIEDLSIDMALEQVKAGNPDLEKAALALDQAQENRDDAAKAVDWIPTGGMVSPSYQTVVNAYQQTEISLALAKQGKDTAADSLAAATISTYIAVYEAANSLELAKLNLSDSKKQYAIRNLSYELGMISDMDYQSIQNNLKQLEQSCTIASNQYQGAVAALRALLNKDDKWVPRLTSRPVLTQYPRKSLETELSRAVEQSSTVKQKKALLDIEESKKSWVLTNMSSTEKANALRTAEINYEETVKDARSSVESDYYAIDTAELQIASAQLALETAQKNRENAELKYKLGLLPAVSATEGLNTYILAEKKAQINLANLQASLAQSKASFGLATGQTLYNASDWSTEVSVTK